MWGAGLEVVPARDRRRRSGPPLLVDRSSWLRAASYSVVFALPDFCRLDLTCFLDRRVIYREPGVGASQLGKLKQNRPGVVSFNESWDVRTLQLD